MGAVFSKRMRLDKYLCECGFGTRSEVRELIRSGAVFVQEKAAFDPKLPIRMDETTGVCADQITVQGQTAVFCGFSYYLYYKPAGLVCTAEDARGRSAYLQFPQIPRHPLFCVGRLDLDTEGLLLLTNDGALSHQLLSPSHHVQKTYYAELDGPVTSEMKRCFLVGVDIGEKKPALPAKLLDTQLLSQKKTRMSEGVLFSDDQLPSAAALVTVCEGKYHQVKRMFRSQGRHVLYLKRICFGPLFLDESMKPGESRPLTKEETDALRQSAGGSV